MIGLLRNRCIWIRLKKQRVPGLLRLGICLWVLLSSLAVLTPPSCLFSAEIQEQVPVKKNSREGVKTFRINIQRLQEGLAAQREQFSETLNMERNLLKEIEEIDRRLAEQSDKLSALVKQRDSQQALIDQKEQELVDVRVEKEKVQRHLQKRINAYYKMGNIGLLNVTFSAQTLPELLRFRDAFQSLIAYDQNVITIYRKSIAALERATKTLNLEKAVLTDFINQAIAEQAAIDVSKDAKQTLLHHIQTQSQLHKQAIAEMEKAEAELSASLLALKTSQDRAEQGFLQKKGFLPPPLSGTLVALFQQEVTNALGIAKKSSGIAIKAVDGSKVKAIFPGSVIFAGYLRGYGNTIIVHHGFQYYSITSRVEKVLVQKDIPVETGTVLGETGGTATLVDEGVYFEIRHGSTSLDPMLWLAPGGLHYPEDIPSSEF